MVCTVRKLCLSTKQSSNIRQVQILKYMSVSTTSNSRDGQMGANEPIVTRSGFLMALGQALITYNTAMAPCFSLFAHPCNWYENSDEHWSWGHYRSARHPGVISNTAALTTGLKAIVSPWQIIINIIAHCGIFNLYYRRPLFQYAARSELTDSCTTRK